MKEKAIVRLSRKIKEKKESSTFTTTWRGKWHSKPTANWVLDIKSEARNQIPLCWNGASGDTNELSPIKIYLSIEKSPIKMNPEISFLYFLDTKRSIKRIEKVTRTWTWQHPESSIPTTSNSIYSYSAYWWPNLIKESVYSISKKLCIHLVMFACLFYRAT